MGTEQGELQDKSIKSLQVPVRQRLQQSEFLLGKKNTCGTWFCIKRNSLAIINWKSILQNEKAKSSQGTARDGEDGGVGWDGKQSRFKWGKNSLPMREREGWHQ